MINVLHMLMSKCGFHMFDTRDWWANFDKSMNHTFTYALMSYTRFSDWFLANRQDRLQQGLSSDVKAEDKR